MGNSRTVKKVVDTRPEGTRKTGGPETKWEDGLIQGPEREKLGECSCEYRRLAEASEEEQGPHRTGEAMMMKCISNTLRLPPTMHSRTMFKTRPVGASSRMNGTDPVSETLWFLPNMISRIKLNNPVKLNVIYRCQNPSEVRPIYFSFLGFEVFTAVTMKNAVFWGAAPCRCGRLNRR
jgi:hypothetical protein